MNALRLLCALLGRPEVRGNAAVLRALLPQLLQPLLDLLRPPGCAPSPAARARHAVHAWQHSVLRVNVSTEEAPGPTSCLTRSLRHSHAEPFWTYSKTCICLCV